MPIELRDPKTVEEKQIADSFRNAAHQGAFWKGFAAFHRGSRREENDYTDKRGNRDMITFSRSYRRFWTDGWDYASRGGKTFWVYIPRNRSRKSASVLSPA